MKLITYETYYLCQGFTNVLENSFFKKNGCSSTHGDAVLPQEI